MEKKDITNHFSRGAFFLSGLLCVFHAPSINKWFPFLIGIVMTLVGLSMFWDTYPALRKEKGELEFYSSRMSRSILLVMLGLSTFFMGRDAMPFLGVSWGLLGLIKGGRGLTIVLACRKWNKEVTFVLVKAIVGIGLSFILLFNPVDAVGKHIVLLGLQIIYHACFRMESKSLVDTLHGQVDELSKATR